MVAAATAEGPQVVRSASALITEAARHVAARNMEAALAALAEASARDQDYMPLHFVTALIAWRMGNLAKALELVRACLEREPMNGTVAEVLASLYAQVGNLGESLYHGKLATALNPDEAMKELVPADFPSFDKTFFEIQDRPLFAYARFFRSRGALDKALESARQHVEVAPDDAEAHQFYVDCLLQRGLAGSVVEAAKPLIERGRPAPALTSLYARALTAVGDFTQARRWHDNACRAAPQDAGITAARLADAIWLDGDKADTSAGAAEWAKKFTKPPEPVRRSGPREKIVIGYLVPHFFDRGDAAAVAAVARAHGRGEAEVVGYGLGPQTWDENMVMSGAFDHWRDVTGLDPATWARTLSSDGLHVVIDVGGLGAPDNLQTLARSNSMIRVAWLHNPMGLDSLYDSIIINRGAAGPANLRPWSVGWGGYPLVRDWKKRPERTVDKNCRFGADIQLCHLGPETVELWSAVLNSLPQSALLLRENDMASVPNINRLVERFGRSLAARIDIVHAATADEFYKQVDIALTPTTGVSPRMAAEALSFGVPALALDQASAVGSYAVVLKELGLGEMLVAGTAAEYIEKARLLALSAEKRSLAVAAVEAVAARGRESAAEIALAIERAAREALAEIAA